jgi:hypothetical protein
MAIDEETLHYLEANRPPHIASPASAEKQILTEQTRELPTAPASNSLRLPLKMSDTTPTKKQPPRLLHP